MQGELLCMSAGAGDRAHALAGGSTHALLSAAGHAKGHLAAGAGDMHCERTGQAGSCNNFGVSLRAAAVNNWRSQERRAREHACLCCLWQAAGLRR